MRCKRHTVDFSSSIGVCASCLRERLFSLAASTAASEANDHKTSPPPHPRPLFFPRSVSPYVSARKSDAGRGRADITLASSHNRFFPTPQVSSSTAVGRTSSSEKLFDSSRSLKKKQSKLSRFSSLFRTRSEEFKDSSDASTSSPPSSSSWLSKVLSFRSKKPSSNTCYIEDLIASESSHRPRQRHHRGMSPATVDYELEETPERVKRTPAAAMGTPGRRKTAMIGSGMGFCLSPLVRAKPNGSSTWKGKLPPEFGYNYTGELKSPARPHISTAASFCANRSKKLVDLGRVDPRR
ncbi:unnamed protein product [Eruca vesicaria subsp. sativa]|uniref:Uncharacterized protein n=1 Tax=Eruca vesicaria subsp. sativa TaxID=29727 RepID=A0ABC8IUL9_ERUVS|nr:unnamed protein product [Eruca vesicaria subsp. sativa]